MLKNIYEGILMNPFILVVFTVVLLNYISGIIKNIRLIYTDIVAFGFKRSKLLKSLFELIQKVMAITLLILSHFLFNNFKIDVLTDAYKYVFYFFLIIIISYHANSILVNVAHVFGFKDLVLLKNLDDYLKSLMGKSVIISSEVK